MLQAEQSRKYKKPLGESHCVSNLKVLGSDKAEFKVWNEKLINAMTQTLGRPWRKYMYSLNAALDSGRKMLDDIELGELDGATDLEEQVQAEEDLYYVLVEKTEGEAALRVQSGTPGEGLQAYMKVYLWFAGAAGLALAEMPRAVTQPTPPAIEYDIADALEKWVDQER